MNLKWPMKMEYWVLGIGYWVLGITEVESDKTSILGRALALS